MKNTSKIASALSLILLLGSAAPAVAQFKKAKTPDPANPPTPVTSSVGTDSVAQDAAKQRLDRLKRLAQENALISKAEREGVEALLETLCHFRGMWTQQLLGVGLVTGLEGTGDSQSYTATQLAAANLLRKTGANVDTATFTSKNIALVTVTCELPPYSSPGQDLDVTVSTLGDAKSLRNGTLIFTPLKYPGSDTTYAVARGQISVGGFSASAKGSSASRGFVTVGKVPKGAIVQQGVATSTVFQGKMYLDLDQQDVTTASRIEDRILQAYPELNPHALGGGAVELTLPQGKSQSMIQSEILQLSVRANTPAKVVIDERSGTIVIGGNVRIAPCTVAQGSIHVQISEDLSSGLLNDLIGGKQSGNPPANVSASEDTAQVTVLRPNTSVADLAEIFQALKLSATDIIAILENMQAQGALKAKLVIQ